jgi:hypothetical protein
MNTLYEGLYEKVQERAMELAAVATVSASYEVLDSNLEDLTEKVEKLNRKCAKLNLPAITMTVGDVFIRAIEIDRVDMVAIVQERYFYPVTITGVSPKIDGYQFIASVDHLEECNVINVCPFSLEIAACLDMEAYRTVNATCEHCNTLRARNSTYVIYNEKDNTAKRVGKSCLALYTGTKDVHAIAAYAEELHELQNALDSYEEDRGASSKHASLTNLIRWVVLSIRLNGWVPKSKAYEVCVCSTASSAQEMQAKFDKGYTREAPSEADNALATSAIEWVRSLTDKERADSEYIWNLYTVCRNNIISLKHTGIAASLIVAYQKHMQGEFEKKNTVASEWLTGEKGSKVVISATCVRITPIETQYGVTFVHTFVTDDGRKVTWFASNPFDKSNCPLCVVGNLYKVSGTVKDFKNEEKYGKTTILTRCKIA